MQQDHPISDPLNRVILIDAQVKILGEQIYTLFVQRLQAGWLVDGHGQAVIELADRKLTELTQSPPNFIAIATHDPILFIANLMAGWRLGIPIFLANPHWGTLEWEQVNSLTAQVDLNLHRHLIMIPTGGSSGTVKFAMHTWKTLSASVSGFQEFYELEKVNSVCVLPLYHVSGLMQLMRSLLTDGKLLIADYHQFLIDPNPAINRIEIDNYLISLVPTQLHKLSNLHPNCLTKFQTILLGGAAANIEILNRSRLAGLPVALTYGMTETASQITSLKPAEFLAGTNNCGRVLPHAEVRSILTLDNQFGAIQVKAKSLMLGYFPDRDAITYFNTDDLGSIDERGYLTIGGRNSGKIITGGENVISIEVINAILATGLVVDTWVFGLPDPYWGEIVAAVYVEGDLPISGDQLATAIADKISKYKIPKFWLAVDQIPRNSLGKISNIAVKSLVQSRLAPVREPINQLGG